jgi:hypothetical protein
MSQEEMSQLDTEEEEVEISIDGAILTTEAELRAWYIHTNPLLRSVGLSCPATLYREMQRDLRDFDATVAIVPVSEDMDETLAKRVLHCMDFGKGLMRVKSKTLRAAKKKFKIRAAS